MNELVKIGPISPLRQRLLDDMALRRFGSETQRNYLRDVSRFATWLQRSPHTATAEDTSPARRHPRRYHPGHRRRDPARLIHSHTRRSPASGSGHACARAAEKQTPDAQNQTVSVRTSALAT